MEASLAVTLEQVKQRRDVQAYIGAADRNMALIGYTEHGFRHAQLTADRALKILLELGRGELAELAAIAGYLHDIGNMASRAFHGQVSVMVAHHVLTELGMPPEELAQVIAAVGNHEEEYGDPFGPVAAAVVIADKSDVSRSRVRTARPEEFDEHDRVNYATIESELLIDPEKRVITLHLKIDPELGSIMEYFELFLSRMVMSRRAAEALGARFSLQINGTRLL